MKKILYIFYRYYNDGATKDVAYLKSVTVFLLLLLINILTVCAFAGFKLPDTEGASTITKYLVFLIFYSLPLYLIINYFVKKKDLEDDKLALEYKSIHGWFLVFYFILSIFLLILAVRYKSR
jgi:hypothetical protein